MSGDSKVRRQQLRTYIDGSGSDGGGDDGGDDATYEVSQLLRVNSFAQSYMRSTSTHHRKIRT